MARPKKEVNEQMLKQLAGIHCTMNEMSAMLGVSVDTLERRYADTIKEARESGKMSLRRAMFKKALDGNPTMQIWLSKQHLGMVDKQEHSLDTDTKNAIKLTYSLPKKDDGVGGVC